MKNKKSCYTPKYKHQIVGSKVVTSASVKLKISCFSILMELEELIVNFRHLRLKIRVTK